MAGAGARALCAVLLCGLLPGSQQTLRPPRLVPSAGQTLLQPGDTLRVTCQATRPVTWNVTSLARGTRRRTRRFMRRNGIQDIADRVRITDGGGHQQTDGYPYVSNLEIRDVGYLDVGYQSCAYVGTTSLDDAQNVSRVYLFVNDTNHPLVYVDGGLPFVTLTQNEPGVIPCRPSHPDVRVRLFKDHKQITDLAAKSFIFKKTEGFVIPFPVLFHHSGTFVCKAEVGELQDTVQYHVLFNRATERAPEPRIDKSDARNAVLGHNFTLVCRVDRDADVFVNLKWEVPAASTGLKTGRIVESDTVLEDSSAFRSAAKVAVRRLLITDTQPEDNGTYTCRVRDHNSNSNSHSEMIHVHSANTSSVELQTGVQSFRMQAGRNVKIVVNVVAHPSPDIVWLDPYGEEIVDRDLKQTVTHTHDQTILDVFDLTLEDMGQYTVTASSPDGIASDTLIFNLTVLDAPRVSVRQQDGFYRAGGTFQLDCDVSGFPAPDVVWRFKHCTPEQCDQFFTDVALTKLNDESEVRLSSSSYQVQSELVVTATKSGYYQCSAVNSAMSGELQHAQSSLQFFVSDIDGGFGIQRSTAKVVAGDDIKMACGGSNLAFSGVDSFAWYWSGGHSQQLDPLVGGYGMAVEARTTQYSYQKVLHLKSVRQEQSGRYLCSGFNNNGSENRTETPLIVHGAQPPVFEESANMDESVRLVLDEGTPAELNCTVDGLPRPSVTWTKDGSPLTPGDTGRIRLADQGQRLVISAAIDGDAGNYECRAANREGALVGSAELVLAGAGGEGTTSVILAVVIVLVVCLLAVAACLVWKCQQQKNLQMRLTKVELEAFNSGKMSQFNPDMPIDEQAELLPYDDEWEFPKERLILGRQIGSGAFGRVLKAEAVGLTAHEPRSVIAVKMPKSGSDPDQIRSLMAELKIMIQLGKHLNVVNLLGAVTRHAAAGEFMVLVEYCRHGNLHQYLHRHKNSFINQIDAISGEFDPSLGEEEFNAAVIGSQDCESTPLNYASLDHENGRLIITSNGSHYQAPRRGSTASSIASATYNTDGTVSTSVYQSPAGSEYRAPRPYRATPEHATTPRRRQTPLTTRDLLRWSYQVARGMEYLASRKLLHGDLAARNILLAEDSIVKISDFGLSRDMYKTRDYRKKGKGLLPVKWMAIESIQESIFSTQSDVWSFGVVMWELFSLGTTPYPGMEYDVNFVRRLRDGYRMELPKFSPNSTYRLMMECWRELPGDRPSFPEISESLGHCLEDHVKRQYVCLNEPFEEGNRAYFARRIDYVNDIVSPDYQNVTSRDVEVTSRDGAEPDVTLEPRLQSARYATPGKDVRDRPLTDTDSYLLMTPPPELTPDVFSPRPTAIVRPGSHFEFPPPPQLTPPLEPAPGFYNPAYHEAAKVMASGGRVPSTPKMGTRATRPPRAAAQQQQHRHCDSPETDEQEHYLTPVSGDPEHYLTPVSGDPEHYLTPVSGDLEHYLTPVSSDPEHYLTPVSGDPEHYLTPVSGDPEHYLTPVSGDPEHYQHPGAVGAATYHCPVPVGCERLD